MKRATYSWKVVGDLVLVVDEDQGRSVTNDAERVVRDLAGHLEGRRLLYRDSMGRWDELVVEEGRFAGFAPGSAADQAACEGMVE